MFGFYTFANTRFVRRCYNDIESFFCKWLGFLLLANSAIGHGERKVCVLHCKVSKRLVKLKLGILMSINPRGLGTAPQKLNLLFLSIFSQIMLASGLERVAQKGHDKEVWHFEEMQIQIKKFLQ